ALGIVCGPEFPAMRSNDGSADREAQAHSLGFRGEERLEHSFHFSLLNAATLIDDRHNHRASIVFECSTNAQPAFPSAALSHRVTSIDHQVDQDLLKLHRVASDSRQTS